MRFLSGWLAAHRQERRRRPLTSELGDLEARFRRQIDAGEFEAADRTAVELSDVWHRLEEIR